MNLIDQLGGYEKAKWWELHLANAESKGIHHTGSNSALRFTLNESRVALLKYRRQHNIYEVGDLVVMADADDYDTIFKVIGKPQRLYHLQGNDDLFYGRLDFQIRHATDAEIEAGKRLEVG